MSKILFITADPHEAKSLQKYFSEENAVFQITPTNFKSAARLLDNENYQLMLTDCGKGASVPASLSANIKKFSAKLPVIVLMDEFDDSKKKKFLDLGAHNVITKTPDYFQILNSIINTHSQNSIEEKIISGVDIPIIATDLKGIITYSNSPSEHLFGWKSDEVIGKPISTIFEFDFGVQNKNLSIIDIIKDNEHWHGEILLQNKHQAKLFIELKLKRIKDGRQSIAVGSYIDITAKKENDRKLHLLSDVILNVSDGVVLTDLENNIIFVNDAKAKMSGYTTEELIGQNISVLAGGDETLSKNMDDITNDLKTRGIYSGELIEKTKNGREIIIRLTNKLLRDDNGNPYAILGTSQDITETKKLENQLRESEEWYRTLVTNINGILIFLDIYGNIIYINQPAETFLGYTLDEIKGQNYFDVFISDSTQNSLTRESLTEILTGKSIKGIHATAKSRNDGIRYSVYNVSPRYDIRMNINGIIVNGIDITELKTLERQLAETYSYLENIILNSADGIATFDLDAKVVTWNTACERIYGYTAKEIIGKSVVLTVPSQHYAEWKKIYDSVLKGETFNNLEVERISKFGSVLNLLLTVSPIRNMNGKIIGISSFIRDITEKKLLEKQAYMSEVKYRQLFEESKDFIFEITTDGRFISINQAGVELLGYETKEEVFNLFVPQDVYVNQDEMERFVTEIRTAGYVVDFEIQIKKKNGEKITIIETATAVHGDDNKMISYRGIGHDTTEKKRHQERIISLLIASQAFSRTTTEEEIFDSIAKAIRRLGYNLIILLKEANTLKIARTTFDSGLLRGMEKLYNFRFDSYRIPYKKFPGFVSVIDHKKTVLNEHSISRLIDILPRNIPREAIESIANEVGYRNRSISVPLVVFDDVIGLALINSDEFKQEDVSIFNLYAAQLNSALENARLYHQLSQANEDLKKAYEKLHESQAMLIHGEKMKAIGDLASGVAHDFNNLLGVIVGRTQLLQLRSTDQKMKNDLIVILKAAMDGAETVKRLQDFSKKKAEDNASAIDVNLIIEDTIELTQTKWKDVAQQRGVKVTIRKDFDKLPIVFGSGSELREILTNLILNAVDAMPQGGAITIRTKNLDRLYSIEIEDTGTGIPQESLSKIFTPFYTTKGDKGTGLGLSMVKMLVTKRQGDIRVTSELGIGTKFTITFPKVNIANSDQKPQNENSDSLIGHTPNAQLSVLVIDDEEEIRILLAEILREADYKVIMAKNGREGIDKFKQGNVDIVFTDLGMPEINGWQVAKEIKEINPITPVVLISGWGRDLKEQDITNTGVDYLAAKPFHIDEIFQLLMSSKNLIAERKSNQTF